MTELGALLSAYARTLEPAALERAHFYVYSECMELDLTLAKGASLQRLFRQEYQQTLRDFCVSAKVDVVSAVDIARSRLYCLEKSFACTRGRMHSMGLPSLDGKAQGQQQEPAFLAAARIIDASMEGLRTFSATRAGHLLFAWARISSTGVLAQAHVPALSEKQLSVLHGLVAELPVFLALGSRWGGCSGISRQLATYLDADDLGLIFARPPHARRRSRHVCHAVPGGKRQSSRVRGRPESDSGTSKAAKKHRFGQYIFA